MVYIAMALSFLAGPAAAQASRVSKPAAPPAEPPAFSLELTNEAAEAAWHPLLKTEELPGFSLSPSVRAGMMALTQTMPYQILMPSPYAAGGLSGVYSGAFELALMGDLGTARINSQKYFVDPAGSAASAASRAPTQDKFSDVFNAASWYGDIGKVVTVGSAVKGAFFASYSEWMLTPQNGGYGAGLSEGNVGTMWMAGDRSNRVSLFGDVRFEQARTAFYRNVGAQYEWVPAQTAGAEYARKVGGGEARVGMEATNSRADVAYRPYVGFSHGKIDTLAAGNLRQGKDPMYPDVKGLGVTVDAEVSRGLRLGVTGAVNNELYAMAPAPTTNASAMVGLTWRMDDDLVVKSAVLYKQAMERSRYQPADSTAINSRLPGIAYAAVFRNALQTSPTFADFVKKVPAHSTDEILSAVSAFAETMGRRNFNENEGRPLNSESIDEIYAKARASYLANRQDPVLVCMGEAQFTAALAQALGRQAGINIQAAAVTVVVPGENGQRGGHAVAMVKTPQYGIVFVDWGQMTPTYTFSTKEALRIFQGLQGIPDVYHIVTNADGNGSHVGYLFTEEGKKMERRLTYHAGAQTGPLNRMFDDDPRSEQITIERYRNRLKKAFDQ